MVMKIYTKRGDSGETGLFGGERVSKDHLRVEAYGTVDELNAYLGWMATAGDEAVQKDLLHLQNLLFELGAQLATPPQKKHTTGGIQAEDVAWLETAIDGMEASLSPLKTFVLPGGSPLAAMGHVARCVCRRAERRTVTLAAQTAVDPRVLEFLNRLSDYFFVWSRYQNHRAKVDDVPWQAR